MNTTGRRTTGWSLAVAWAATLLLVLAGLPGGAHAQVRVEIRAFESQELSGDAVLKGETHGKAVMLAGELRIPGRGKEMLPAVILMHPSPGINSAVEAWVHEFNAMGVATFVVDSASGRGVSRFTADRPQLTYLQLVGDAYRALTLLAKHPRIDPNRIAIMGYSMGGLPARITSMERFRKQFGSGSLEFAAHISLYGACNTSFHDEDKVTGKPIRLFMGTADDFAPVGPCRDLAARLKQAGADVMLTEFPGAHHYFDAAYLKKPIHVAKISARRNCWLVEGDHGQILDVRTRKPYEPQNTCTEQGGSVEYNEAAATATHQALRALLVATFGLKP